MSDDPGVPQPAALLGRHPAPAVQIRAARAPALVACDNAQAASADEPCHPRHFAPRWWPARPGGTLAEAAPACEPPQLCP